MTHGDAETELRAMQQRLMKAVLEGRREDWSAMIAAEWRVTHIDASVLTKQQVLEQVFGGAPPVVAGAIDDVEVQLFGEAAVVTGRTSVTARDGAKVALRFTDFAVRQDSRWLIVASHATQLREG